MDNQPYISIISPIYRANEIIFELVSQIEESIVKVTSNYEIILVEDGSPDSSWESMVKASDKNKNIKLIKLSRNFGQHNAICAGMEAASGDYAILMDCDLQHDPKYFVQLYEQIKNGYEIVYTKTISREHSVVKNITAKFYYRFVKLISDFDMDPNIGSYSMISRKAIEAFNNYNDYRKAYLWALKWTGFEAKVLEIEHQKRFSGKSSYNLKKLIIHAFEVTVANSNKLLYLSIYIGIGTSLLSFLGILYIAIRYLIYGGLEGWSSIMLSIMFFSGLILTSIGISSVYISKLFEQTKNRPRYLIQQKINFND